MLGSERVLLTSLVLCVHRGSWIDPGWHDLDLWADAHVWLCLSCAHVLFLDIFKMVSASQGTGRRGNVGATRDRTELRDTCISPVPGSLTLHYGWQMPLHDDSCIPAQSEARDPINPNTPS